MGVPNLWRTRGQRYSLVGEICPSCSQHIFPPRDVCPHCTKPAGPLHSLSGRGEIYSFSTMYNTPQGYQEQSPYTVALVKLEEGPMVTAQLTDVNKDEVEIGMKVEMVTRKLREDGDEGQIIYGYKFRPLVTMTA
ncbi:Zn-ribbon domain-containing OB-fold protein [Chloroflexi bacterium TSY]|nr:Zn-ribbon domain-containing OB-fold protein [Chloroflexi bacterium TSY]